jgi:hypothetical protein
MQHVETQLTNVCMHAKPFGYGDGDSHVVINHTDPRFAVENLDFDPDSYDDGSQRLKSAGKVSRMRTSGPIHTGARLPRIRPLTPLEDPKHQKYGHAPVDPRRGTAAKTSKSVAFQVAVLWWRFHVFTLRILGHVPRLNLLVANQ